MEHAGTKAAALAVAGLVGSIVAAYLKFGVAIEVWLLALGLFGLALILTAAIVVLKALRWPIAFGTLVALGGVAAHLAYVA